MYSFFQKYLSAVVIFVSIFVNSVFPLIPSTVHAAWSVDLSVIESGPTSANNGDHFSYLITMSNTGPDSADGASFIDTLFAWATNVSAVCTGSNNGASCPTFTTISNSTVEWVIPTFPNQWMVTLTVSGYFPVISPTSLRNDITVNPPIGTSENNTTTNTSVVNTQITMQSADLTTSLSGSSVPIIYGTPFEYVITHTNNGPGPANGSTIADRISMNGGSIEYTDFSLSCTASGGAICPPWLGSSFPASGSLYQEQLYGGSWWGTPVNTWPSGGSLEIHVKLTPLNVAVSSCDQPTISQNIRANAFAQTPFGITDSNSANNSQSLDAHHQSSCVDLYVLKSVSDGAPAPSTSMYFDLFFWNAGPGNSYNSQIQDVLPSGFLYASGSCSASGGWVCGSLDYNTTSRLFSSIIPELPYNSSVTYRLFGTAIDYSSSWNNTTTISSPNTEVERNTSTNTSTVNFTVTGDDPVVTIRALDLEIQEQDPARYQVIISNPSNGAILNSGSITNILPSGFTYLSTQSVVLSWWATRIGNQNPNIWETTLVWTDFTLPPGATVTIDFSAVPGSSLPCGSQIYNDSAQYDYRSLVTWIGSRSYDGNLIDRNADDVIILCPSPIIANPDAYSLQNNQTGSFLILSNDTYSGSIVDPNNFSLSITNSGWLASLSLDSLWNLQVPLWTASGSYLIGYQICEKAHPANCSSTTATIVVTIGVVPPVVVPTEVIPPVVPPPVVTTWGWGGSFVSVVSPQVSVIPSVSVVPSIPMFPKPSPESHATSTLVPTTSLDKGHRIFEVKNRLTDYICPKVIQVWESDQLNATDIVWSAYIDALSRVIRFRAVEKDEEITGQTLTTYRDQWVAINDAAYEPNRPVTRAEFVKMLVRSLACRYQYMWKDAGFPDIHESDWYSEYITFAVKNHWINGYEDGDFRPNAFITRAEAAKIFMNAIHLQPSSWKLVLFSDVSSESVFAPYIETLNRVGVMKGIRGNLFFPENTILRTEASDMIARVFFGLEK